MKARIIILLGIILMFSCSEDENATCRAVQAIESQDYQHGGEKLQYDFTYTDGVLTQMKKSIFINDIPQFFYSMDYFYNDQNQLVLVKQRNTSNLLRSFEFEYDKDRLIKYTAKSEVTQARAERTIHYSTDNEINRVDFTSSDPFEVFYVTVQHTGDFQYLISYYDAQDQFTGSIEVKTKPIATAPELSLLFLERFYNSPQYLFGNKNVITELNYKDKDGAEGSKISYDYMINNGILNQFTLDQGFRVDLFELRYDCK